MRVRIHGGRVIDPANGEDEVRDVFVDGGVIIDPVVAGFRFTPDYEINATDRVVCPGLVDLQARLGEPGLEHKATMESELNASIAGGVTTLCVRPDTHPIIDTPAMVHMVQEHAQKIKKARVYPLGALTTGLAGEKLSDMAALREAGCVGVTNADVGIDNTLIMRRAMQYATTFDLAVFLTPLDPWLKGNGCVHEGEVSTRLGLPAIPEAAEVVALARELALIETTGCRAHITQLSCARSVEKLREAKARGLEVTAAVSAHHLHLSDEDIGEFDTRCHTIPPLRSAADRNALRTGLLEGTIDAVCSDHQPHSLDAKLTPFSESAPGIAGLETLLSLVLKIVEEGAMPLLDAFSRVTINPAQILGINAGQIAPGSPADLCVVDPSAHWKIDPSQFRSRGRNSPFDGDSLPGVVDEVLIAGRPVKI